MERVDGIEPTSSAWKAAALPLCYTREPKGRRYCERPFSSSAECGSGHDSPRHITASRHVGNRDE